MKIKLPLGLLVSLVLTACGGSSAPAVNAQGGSDELVRPGPPTADRTGRIYNVTIPSPLGGGEVIAFTVLEPATIHAGSTYPMILHSHGFAGSREKGKTPTSPLGYSLAPFVDNGYGALSLDERGHGDSGGTITVMDPDHEGKNWLAVLDWAEENLDWLAYGPDDDAPATAFPNPLIGAVGGSYGGGYQLMIHAIDPRKRLDALAPNITWSDLTYSLAPGGVNKTGWISVLFGAGNTSGGGNNFDPFVTALLADGLTNNRLSEEGRDYLRYHGLDYFCDGVPVNTNGGAGTRPFYPANRPTRIHTLLTQGYRDTLFNFNDLYENYRCLQALGGDVRVLTYQGGHNTLQVVPDPGQAYQPAGSTAGAVCGTLNKEAAAQAFFNEHLKGQIGAIAAAQLPTTFCLSLAGTDAIHVDSLVTGRNGTEFTLPPTVVAAGSGLDVAIPAQLGAGAIAGADGNVLAGIPHAEFTVSATSPVAPGNDPIIFVGIGHRRATGAGAGVWDLVDNQLQPLRGLGNFSVDLVGVAERLRVGDEVALLFYGAHNQFHLGGARPPNNFPVTVTGTVWLPLLGNVPSATP